jgi:hypothetical protein
LPVRLATARLAEGIFMLVRCHKPIVTTELDELRLQLAIKQEMKAIVDRHTNFFPTSDEEDFYCLEIALLQERIAKVEAGMEP